MVAQAFSLNHLVQYIKVFNPNKKMKRVNSTENQKKVRFADDVDVKATISRSGYTSEEVNACWFNGNDYERIRFSCFAIIEMTENKTITQKYCTWGLEALTSIGRVKRRCNKGEAVECVLEEQRRQYDEDVCDPERIASLYRGVVSERCQREAHERANLDALEVQKILTKTFCQRSDKKSRSLDASKYMVKRQRHD